MYVFEYKSLLKSEKPKMKNQQKFLSWPIIAETVGLFMYFSGKKPCKKQVFNIWTRQSAIKSPGTISEYLR